MDSRSIHGNHISGITVEELVIDVSKDNLQQGLRDFVASHDLGIIMVRSVNNLNKTKHLVI